jgi:hypothetical protein
MLGDITIIAVVRVIVCMHDKIAGESLVTFIC